MGPDEQTVKFSEKQAERLTKLYQQAEQELTDALNRGMMRGNDTSYLRGMLSNVKSILSDLEKGSRDWSMSAIPAVYSEGIEFANKQLKDSGIQVGFGAIHQHAAQVLAESVYNRLQDVVSFIGRRVDDIYRKLSLEAVRGSTLGYETYNQAAKKLKDNLAQNGVTGFVDKSGKNWNMSTYADMVGVTSTMEAHLEGTRNRLLENGQELVIVSEHGGSCKHCQPWEGKVLALTMDYQGDYPIDGTVDDARAEGLFHPRCRHAYGLYIPELMDGTFDPSTMDESNADDFESGEDVNLADEGTSFGDQAQAHIASWGASGPQTEEQVRQLGSMVRQEVEKRQAAKVDPLQKEVADLEQQAQEAKALFKQLQQEDTLASQGTDSAKAKQVRDDLWKQNDKLYSIQSDLQQKRDELNKAIPDIRREVLSEVRDLGMKGKYNWAPGTHSKVKDALDGVTKYLPADWLKVSSESQSVMKGRVVSRGYYSGGVSSADFMLSGVSQERLERVAAHEFGHRTEHMIPVIKKLEYQFYQRRTDGEALKWMGAGYRQNEKSRKDNFLDKYMGKDYGNKETSYYELLSMGLEGLFRPSTWQIEQDTDFYDFILGLVAGVKP